MTHLIMLGNSFCRLGQVLLTKDLVLLCYLKVHLFENSILKIMAQLHYEGFLSLQIFKTS